MEGRLNLTDERTAIAVVHRVRAMGQAVFDHVGRTYTAKAFNYGDILAIETDLADKKVGVYAHSFDSEGLLAALAVLDQQVPTDA